MVLIKLNQYAHETAYGAPAAVSPWSFTPETICESAARLLFMNVRWAKSVPAFTALPGRDQIVLLEESWRELFVLGAAQFMLPIEAGTLMAALGLSNSPYASLASRKTPIHHFFHSFNLVISSILLVISIISIYYFY